MISVYSEMISLAPRWRNLGLALGLLESDMRRIEYTHPRSSRDCLGELLVKWLKCGYDINKHGFPTWRKIVEVTAEPAAGANPALAETMARNHQGNHIW